MINYLYPVIFIFGILYIFKIYNDLKVLKGDFSVSSIESIDLLRYLIKLYSNVLLRTFAFFLIVVFIFFFIRKDFGFLLFYGFFLFVLYSFIEFVILFNISILSKAFYIEREGKLNSLFTISKFLSLLIIVFFLYNFYLKAGVDYDYPIVLFSSLFIACILNIISNDDSNSLSFINSLVTSFISITLITFGFRYLSLNYVSNIILLWGLFLFLVLLDQIFTRHINISKMLLKDFFVSLLYPVLVVIFIYIRFNLDLFVFLIFFVNYILLFFIFELRHNLDKHFRIILLVFFVFFLFLSRMLYVFVVGISYDKMIIFIILLMFPLLYYYLVKDQYFVVKEIFTKGKEVAFNLNFSFSGLFLFLGALSFFSFKIAYDYMSIYYNYNDSFSFISIIVPFVFFYLIENYSLLIKRLDNLFLDLVFNVSVIVFSYSAQIVILSYVFGLNYINLVSIFCIYFFLTLLYSSKTIHYFVSMLYLLSIYIIIYV